MSVEAMTFAKKIKAGRPAIKVVLLCIADYIDYWGWAYAPQEMIADEAEVSERSVRRYIFDLETAGILAVYQGRNKSGNLYNLYQLVGFTPSKPKREMSDKHPSRNWNLKRIHKNGSTHKFSICPAPPADNLSYGKGNVATGQAASNQRPNADDPPVTALAAKTIQQNKQIARRRARDQGAARSGGSGSKPPPDQASTPDDLGNSLNPRELQQWREFKGRMMIELGEARFKSWVEPLELLSTTPALSIGVEYEMIKDRLLGEYAVAFSGCINQAFGDQVIEINWVYKSKPKHVAI